MNEYTFKEGDKVFFNVGVIYGSGTIRGISSVPFAVIGAMYIIELDEKIEGWDYSCIVCAEVNISKVDVS